MSGFVELREDGVNRLIDGSNYVEMNDNRYGSQISKLNDLALKAKADFPSLKDSDIEVVQFAGISKKGIFGLHFKSPDKDPVPKDYRVISSRELIL
jgi:hypothetical protein